jgi:hypothetical protein
VGLSCWISRTDCWHNQLKISCILLIIPAMLFLKFARLARGGQLLFSLTGNGYLPVDAKV